MKNKYKIKGKTTEIYVQSPKYGLKTIFIDTEDLFRISKHNWCIHLQCGSKSNFYSQTTTRSCVQIHNLIMKEKPIDHINHNGLDNRKCNLRICSNQKNQYNQRINKNNTSGFKGVTYKKKDKNYQTRIGQMNLGRFMDIADAAIQYDLAALILFKEFAYLNFPNKDYTQLLKVYNSIHKLKQRSKHIKLQKVKEID